jgi:hypothetical protein
MVLKRSSAQPSREHVHHARGQRDAQPGQRGAVALPQLRLRQRAQPIDDAAEKGEQQRFEGADAGGQQGHQQQVRAQALRAGPEEGQQFSRRRQRCLVRVRRDQAFEEGEHASFGRGAQG